MAIKELSYLKGQFQTGDTPSQQDFIDLLESFFTGNPQNLQITSATDQIAPTYSLTILTTDSGSITLTSNPQLTEGENAQMLCIIGNSDSNYVTLIDGNGLNLSSNFELKLGYAIILQYSDTISGWTEIARNRISFSDLLGSLDHGALTGRDDDDHTIYTKADGTRAFTGDQSMGSKKLTNVAAPVDGGDAINKTYLEANYTLDHGTLIGRGDDDHTQYTLVDGTRAFTGDQSMGSHKLTNVTTPAVSADAATKGYVDSVVNGLAWQDSVIDKDLTGPPISPSIGDRYIVAIDSTSDWEGYDLDIAAWNDGTNWEFVVKSEGMACWVKDEDINYTYNGTSWVTFGSTQDHGNLNGLDDDDHTQYLLKSGSRELTGPWNAGQVITATGFTIGANALTTDEFGYLDGINQTVATTSSPIFAGLTVGSGSGVVKATSGVLSADATTTDLAEGDNQYYTDEKVDDRVSSLAVAGEGIDITYDDEEGTLTVSGEDASTTNKGIAKFDSNNFSATTGTIALKDGGIANTKLANDSITITGDTGSNDTNLGTTFDVEGGTGITTEVSSGKVTVTGSNATTSAKGIAQFDSSNFSVTAGAVAIKDSGISNDELAGGIADSKLSTITTSNKVSGSAVQLAATSAIEDSTGLKLKAGVAGTGITLTDQVLSISTDGILDTHINWGTGVNQVNTSDVPELTNLFFTDARARLAISGTAPIEYDTDTGVIVLGYNTTDFELDENSDLSIKTIDGGEL